MGTPHNAAEKGQIAKTVLMPGDPLRAKYIAETYLEKPVCFNTVRNMLGFTGTYHGKEVSVMGSGMGMPSIGIYSYELYHFYDVENIIRIGSAGAMQDDVNVIEEMVDKFHEGKDIVYGVRSSRKKDSFFKRSTAQGFYRFMSLMGVKTIYNHADFRLMSRRAVEQFSRYEESNLFLRGMVPLIGYETDSVYYERRERAAGESKYPFKKMLALALNGITSFSIKPIGLITTLGFLIVIGSVAAAVYALISYFTENAVPGWTSLILSIWFIGGVQLLAIGLVGQYIGKIYMEVKHRPRYNIEKIL